MADLFNSAIEKAISEIHLAEKIKDRKVYSRQLNGTSLYQFCPHCMKDKAINAAMMKRFFQIKDKLKKTVDEQDFCNQIINAGLQPLYEVRRKELVKVSEDTGQVMFNNYLECPVCGKEVTMDDYYKSYCVPPKEDTLKKYINLNDVNEMNLF